MKEFKLYNDTVILQFDEEPHNYYFNGELVPGVTEILGNISKEALKGWAARCAVDFIRKQWRPRVVFEQGTIDKVLNRAPYHYDNVSKFATFVGSQSHNWIEEFSNCKIDGKSDKKSIEIATDKIDLTRPESVLGVKNFLNWYNNNDVQIIASEKKVFSLEYLYSGTFDLLAYVNGKLCLIDFKTSRRIYPEYYLQGSAYYNAFMEEREYYINNKIDHPFYRKDLNIDNFIVLHISKWEETWEEGMIIAEEMERIFPYFEAAWQIQNWRTVSKKLNIKTTKSN